MFKSILAIAEGGPDSAMSYRLAAHLAEAFGGTVDAIYLSPTKVEDAEMGVQAMPFLKDVNLHRHKARAATAKAAFAEFLSRFPDSSFSDDSRIVLDHVVAHGRRADLIVVGRPGADPENAEPSSVDAAIHECAKPVLIAPPDPHLRPLDSVVIAWNGSSQAARAVGHALPILKKAGTVTILVVDETPDAVGAPLLVSYLARHGIVAGTEVIGPDAATGRQRGRAVVDHARTRAAHLLVMGAYGGGKLASFLGLGGATAKIVSSCPIPVLVAH